MPEKKHLMLLASPTHAKTVWLAQYLNGKQRKPSSAIRLSWFRLRVCHVFSMSSPVESLLDSRSLSHFLEQSCRAEPAITRAQCVFALELSSPPSPSSGSPPFTSPSGEPLAGHWRLPIPWAKKQEGRARRRRAAPRTTGGAEFLRPASVFVVVGGRVMFVIFDMFACCAAVVLCAFCFQPLRPCTPCNPSRKAHGTKV